MQTKALCVVYKPCRPLHSKVISDCKLQEGRGLVPSTMAEIQESLPQQV